MKVEYDDDDLKRMLGSDTKKLPRFRYPPEVVKSFRKKMQFLEAAADERDLRGMKSLHFEALRGDRKDTYSIRLNDQYRLIIGIVPDGDGKKLRISTIEDYH